VNATQAAAGGGSAHHEPPHSNWFSGGQLGTWLGNPLLVTVVAALLGSWLLPQITRKWQDHQKALEIKTGLVSEMSQSVSSAIATSRFIAAGLVLRSSSDPRAEQKAWNDGYREWTTTSASVGAKLRAYFGLAIGSEWQSFSYVVTDFLLLSSEPKPGSGRAEQAAEIFRYKSLLGSVHLKPKQWRLLAETREGPAFQGAYAGLGRGLLARRDELVGHVLDSGVSGF
jgi:hypothetical protein